MAKAQRPQHASKLSNYRSGFLVNGMGMSANIPEFQPIQFGCHNEESHGLGVD